MSNIVLASQSPRRKQLLEWAEINFEIIVADTDESFPEALTPEDVALHIALGKAKAVQQRARDRFAILSATLPASKLPNGAVPMNAIV